MAVVSAIVAALLLAWNLLGQAGGTSRALSAAANAAGVIAVDMQPGDGAPSKSPHHPTERKKPRQLELSVVSQVDDTAPASSSSAAIAWVIGNGAPATDPPPTAGPADTAPLPLVSADAGRLRLHPSQAPPSA